MAYHNLTGRQYVSGEFDEAVEDSFAARLVEFDLELVTVDVDDFAVTELFVKNAQSDREVRSRLGADRSGGTFLARRGRADGGRGTGHRALPCRAAGPRSRGDAAK